MGMSSRGERGSSLCWAQYIALWWPLACLAGVLCGEDYQVLAESRVHRYKCEDPQAPTAEIRRLLMHVHITSKRAPEFLSFVWIGGASVHIQPEKEVCVNRFVYETGPSQVCLSAPQQDSSNKTNTQRHRHLGEQHEHPRDEGVAVCVIHAGVELECDHVAQAATANRPRSPVTTHTHTQCCQLPFFSTGFQSISSKPWPLLPL